MMSMMLLYSTYITMCLGLQSYMEYCVVVTRHNGLHGHFGLRVMAKMVHMVILIIKLNAEIIIVIHDYTSIFERMQSNEQKNTFLTSNQRFY